MLKIGDLIVIHHSNGGHKIGLVMDRSSKGVHIQYCDEEKEIIWDLENERAAIRQKHIYEIISGDDS